MIAQDVHDLGRDRRLIDLGFRETSALIGTYLLPLEDGWAIVETGPTRCREALLRGLNVAGVEPKEVRQVFVTHIHLDHAGGAGAVQGDLPNAMFYAHESGIPHLVNPAKLEASARRAWGPAFEPSLGPLVPMDPHRLRPLRGDEVFPLRDGPLRVLATPGHARHHVSYFDVESQAMLTGDSAGVRLPTGDRARPAVPPPDLDLSQLFASLDAMAAMEPCRLWYTHFGSYPNAVRALRDYRPAVQEWVDVGLTAARHDPSVAAIARALREHEMGRIGGEASRRADAIADLVSGVEMAAMGLLRYYERSGLVEAPTSGGAQRERRP